MRINQLNIQEIGKDNDTLKLFAGFLYFKSLYSNSCCYNYSEYKLSGKRLADGSTVKLSKTAIRRYVNKFIELGWCRMHGNNLIFNSINSIGTQKKKLMVEVPQIKNRSIKTILDWLYWQILKLKQQSFDYFKRLGHDKIRASRIAWKSKKRLLKKNVIRFIPKENDMLTVSNTNIAKTLCVSKTTANGIILRLKKRGAIKVFNSGMEVVKMDLSLGKEYIRALIEFNKPTFVHKDNMYFKKCNMYEM
jgi:hypothetical protein